MKKLISILIVLIVIAIFVRIIYGQGTTAPNTNKPTEMYNSSGKPFDRVEGKFREPIILIDTVTVYTRVTDSASYGYIDLSSKSSGCKHNILPTGKYNIFCFLTTMRDDSIKINNYEYYSYWINEDLNRIGIKGLMNDTDRVCVVCFIK